MVILVTGGAGFVGSAFLLRYVQQYPEHRFVNLDALTYAGNPHSLEPLAGHANYAFEHCGLGEAERVVRYCRPDVVFHFAAESHVDRSIWGPADVVHTNVMGTLNLLEACRQQWGPQASGKLFHHVSTDEVYGSLGPTGLFAEDTRYDPSSPYSASKAASDHLVRAYARTYGLPVKITNCTNNYGPRQHPEKLVPLVILRALAGTPIPVYGAGENVREWIHVDDHCDAIWAVAERGRLGETYNVGSGCERRNIDLVRDICGVVADQLGLPRARVEGLIEHVADRPGHDLRYAVDRRKIAREVGWRPTVGMRDGLAETVRWYAENPRWVEQALAKEAA